MKTTAATTRFTLNFVSKTIVGTKASFNKAGKGFGAEYDELSAKMTMHPDFTLKFKEQKKQTTRAKRTYEGLDFSFMERYISTESNAALLLKEYNAVKAEAKEKTGKEYPLTKKWFLGKFSDENNPFDMEKAREKISSHIIATAETKAHSVEATAEKSAEFQGIRTAA